ncbi:MAG: BCCT family transporter [Paracoccaceae bacterium]
MLERLGFRIEPTVFFVSAGLILASVAAIAIVPEEAASMLQAVQAWIASNLGWFYILIVSLFLIFVAGLGASRFGNVRLGADDEEPEFTTLGWFSMLFSAGMGIGLLYNGVGEPLTHYTSPPTAEPQTLAAAEEALLFTFYHWGFHPWAIYSVVGLSIAYFGFRRNMPISLRSAFYPLLGERVNGPIGHAIDIFAVLGTMYGVAASLAIGAKQISAGLNEVFGITPNFATQGTVIAVITLVATVSLISGLNKGIRRLSEGNLMLSGALLVFIFIAGPTVYMLDSFVANLGFYVEIILQTGFWTDPYDQAGQWQESWTIGYWGWWLAWAPFVGMFIARISRGRTIREFVLAVLLVPTVVSFFWFSIAGDTAIQLVRQGNQALVDTLGQENGLDVIFFTFLESFPLAEVTSVVVIVAVFVFFVTSSDSGSFVIDMLTSGGHANPPVAQKIFWAFTEGAVAAVMILAGGLPAVRALVAAAGLPCAILLACMCWALLRALREERALITAVEMAAAEAHVAEHGYEPPADEDAPQREDARSSGGASGVLRPGPAE